MCEKCLDVLCWFVEGLAIGVDICDLFSVIISLSMIYLEWNGDYGVRLLPETFCRLQTFGSEGLSGKQSRFLNYVRKFCINTISKCGTYESCLQGGKQGTLFLLSYAGIY